MKKLAIKKKAYTLDKNLEDLDDIRLYDEAKKNDDGKRIKFINYLKKRKKRKLCL